MGLASKPDGNGSDWSGRLLLEGDGVGWGDDRGQGVDADALS